MSASNLNGYTINWLRGEISTPTSVTSVEPKLLAVLKILVDANGEIVNQDTLMQQVWPNTVVTTNTLQRCIAQLRKLLNDDAKKQQVIKTHPKRGYSVLSSVNNEHAKPKKKPTKLRWLPWLTIGVVTSFAFLFHFFAQGPVIPSLNNIQPINTGAGKLLSASSSGVNQPLAYVRSTDKNQQLIWQQWASQKEQILLEKKRFYGALNFSSDNTKLYFSELEFTGDSKCASLFSYDLNKHNTTPLLKCQNSFIHSGIDISDSQLMYLDTQKNGSSQIKIFSFDTSKTIATQSQSITDFAWHTESKQLAYVDNNHLLTTLTLDADANILSTKHTDLTEIIGVTNKTLSVDWYSSDTLLVSRENALYWISSGELNSTQVLLNSNYIKSFSVDSSTQITALLNRENWDSHLRQLNDGQFQTIEKSAFQEINGQFQPSYHQVSFLSDRAGSLNVWLQNQATVQQITTHSTDVDDYLWKDKSTLWFIANGKLWQQATTGAKQEYPFPHKIIQLFQSQNDQLLVLAETDKGMQLLELDTHTNTSRIVRAENTPWAQKVANNHYIVASTAGQLLRLNQGEVSVIDVLKNLTLQSKFLWRNNQIVFQDKKLNLWQFNPHSNLANIIGKYDINSLFMSDYLAEQELLLSDNKVNVRTELVRLSAK